jgi:hypothetical protein
MTLPTKLVMILLFLLLFTVVRSTAGGNNSDTVVRVSKTVVCISAERALKEIKRAGETVVFRSANTMTNGDSTIILTQNDKTGTWTLLEFNNKTVCQLAYGTTSTGKPI